MERQALYVSLVSSLGGHTKAAKTLQVSQATVSGWTLGNHGMSASVAIRAEKETDKEFKSEDLCSELAQLKSA